MAIAFLYRMAACSMRSHTVMFPSPHGTTTRVLPKHTVTFIFSSAAAALIPKRNEEPRRNAKNHPPLRDDQKLQLWG